MNLGNKDLIIALKNTQIIAKFLVDNIKNDFI